MDDMVSAMMTKWRQQIDQKHLAASQDGSFSSFSGENVVCYLQMKIAQAKRLVSLAVLGQH